MVWAVAAFSMSVSGMSAAWGVGGAGSGRFAQVGTGVCRGVRVASLGIPENGKTVLQVGLVSVLGVEVGRSLLEVGSGLVPVWGGRGGRFAGCCSGIFCLQAHDYPLELCSFRVEGGLAL